MHEMATGANGFINIYFLYFFAHPGAISPMGAMRNWYILHMALPGNAAADSRQPGAISLMGRYHDGTVKDVLVIPYGR